MADPQATDGLWNWCIAGYADGTRVRAAIAAVLERPVVPLGAVPPADGAVLCDVWHVGGEFPTQVDCYLAPGDIAEATAASAVAVRLAHDVLLPDATFNPTRYVLAEADGTLRPVHADDTETDDGTEHGNVRPCTGADPSCAAWPGCGPAAGATGEQATAAA